LSRNVSGAEKCSFEKQSKTLLCDHTLKSSPAGSLDASREMTSTSQFTPVNWS
jgi:hypothetical protein